MAKKWVRRTGYLACLGALICLGWLLETFLVQRKSPVPPSPEASGDPSTATADYAQWSGLMITGGGAARDEAVARLLAARAGEAGSANFASQASSQGAPGDSSVAPSANPGVVLTLGRGDESPSRETSSQKLGGRVIDALDGQPISDAGVRAVFFHAAQADSMSRGDAASGSAAFERALDLWGAATHPRLGAETTRTVLDGTFTLFPPRAGDVRLAAYVEIDRAGYAPAHAVLLRGAAWDGGPGEVEIRLRRAVTVPVEICDPGGAPLPGVPVRVTAWRAGHAFLDAAAVTTAFDGRVLRRAEPELRFTDSRGSLRVSFTGLPHDFELLHPHFALHERRGSEVILEKITTYLPVEGSLRLETQARWTERHRLLDRDGFAVANAEIRVNLEGMPPLRLRTDTAGGFVVGVTHFVPPGEPLGYHHARPGQLTVLDPGFSKRSMPVVFPVLTTELRIQAHGSQRLRFRAVAAEDPARTLAVEPGGIFTSADLTLIEAGPTGVVELVGTLPVPGDILEVVLSGFLPAVQVMPAWRGPGLVELGDIAFARGLERTVVCTGVSRESLCGATLTVEALPGAVSSFGARHRYPMGKDRSIKVSGLLVGTFSVAVTGPLLNAFQGVIRVDEATEGEPIELSVELSSEEDVRLTGRVVDLNPVVAAQVEVVERWWIAGSAEPLLFPAYPLGLDGSFGSVRRLSGVRGVHVAVVTPGERGAEAWLERGEGLPLFAAGELRLRGFPRAEVAFEVEGLGRVLPPARVEIIGERGVESVAHLALRNRRLVAFGLRPGSYALRWIVEGGVEETVGFRVTRQHQVKVSLVAKRLPGVEEGVLLEVLDSKGQPIEGAVAEPRMVEPGIGPALDLDPGIVVARVSPGRLNELSIHAPGRLSAHLRVEPRTEVPGEVTLLAPGGIVADLFDTDLQPFVGRIHVAWEALTPTSITHGSPIVALVHHGKFHATGLPPIPLTFVFRPEGSNVAAFRRLTLSEGGTLDIGKLLLTETRRLSGRVLLPDGTPALNAVVGLVPRKKAYRWPVHEGGIAHAVYAATVDAQGGQFSFDALPVDFAEDWVLLAHADGFQDAVEDPLTLEPTGHDLVLGFETQLQVKVGFADGLPRQDHGFWLEYVRDPADPESRVVLGEVPHEVRAGYTFHGIEPGIYRVRAGLSQVYLPFPGRMESAVVFPGGVGLISMRLEGWVLQGSVQLNGKSLERGWLLLTDDPTGGDVCVGRVLGGKLTLLDPPNSIHGYVAVIPERTPQPMQNVPRGEALPVRYRGYRADLRSGRLDVNYESVDLTIQISNEFLVRHQGVVLSLDYQEWDGTRFVPRAAEEPIEGNTVRLWGLRPGAHRVALRSARDSLILSQTIHLRADHTLDVK